MRISDWSSDVCSSDLIALAATQLSFFPRNQAKLMEIRSAFAKPAPLVEQLPVGTIISYIGLVPPYGWLVCDGKPLPEGPQYAQLGDKQIGRASCRERVCQYV